MTEAPSAPPGKWTYSREFWTANFVELLERAAYYGMFISLTLYLTDRVGFTDVEAGWVSAVFGALLFFMPTLSGAYADAIGFRKALMLAFSLLASGYALLALYQTKPSSIAALSLIMLGGSVIKSTITGTVAKCSTDDNRARAFSVFYLMVNIGAFSGKTVAKPLRTMYGLEYVDCFSAILCVVALLVIVVFFRAVDTTGMGKSLHETLRGMWRVFTNLRFMALIMIVGGFWAIQQQLYATMPKYVVRTVGAMASPEWYANVNPLIVVIFVVPITQMVSRLKAVQSIGISLMLIVCSSLTMSISPWLNDLFRGEAPFGLHPVTVALLLGIGLQGLAECFLSPRFLEYASKQAPPGETGLYMGYSQLTSFWGNLLGFGISGYLLAAWCPDPKTLPADTQAAYAAAMQAGGALPAAYAHAHYIWYVFAGIGLLAFCALLVFNRVTSGSSETGGQTSSSMQV